MKNVNDKACLWMFVISCIIIYTIFCNFSNSNINGLKEIFSIISKIVTIDSLIIFLFSKYFWKYRVFKNWLILIPNLSGTWKGYLYSTWKDPLTGKRPDKIPVILTINQTLFNISCVMRTYEMTSNSFVCNFIIDNDKQVRRLAYMYDSIPKQVVNNRSAQHHGSVLYDLIGNDKKLVGNYYTARKTTGSIKLDFWTSLKKDSIPSDLGEHPVSNIRNKEKSSLDI